MRKISERILGKRRYAPLILAVALSACAGDADFSDELRAQGTQLNEQADRWSKGRGMAKKGNEMIADGRDLVAEGYDKIDKGQKMASEGHRMQQEVETVHATQTAANKQN